MKVSVKELAVTMQLGSKGIELDVYDNKDKHLGDLRVGKAKLEWCSGRTRTGHGIQVSWEELIEFFESRSTK